MYIKGSVSNIGDLKTQTLEDIFNCQGKVILTGMGKSGLVAKKIASTMSGVGTPAIFMHLAEGMHGELGIIGADDVVIAIGKSGESFELNGALPSIKNVGVKIIGIMGEASSTLARYSDIIIDIGNKVLTIAGCTFLLNNQGDIYHRQVSLGKATDIAGILWKR